MLDLAQLFGGLEEPGDVNVQTDGIIVAVDDGNADYCTGYSIRRGKTIDVEINDGTKPSWGKVLDFSHTGVKLLTISSHLNVGDKVVLTVLLPELSLELHRDAYVSWIGHRGESAWHTGFAFADRMEDVVIDRLVECRFLERRGGVRFPVTTSANLRSIDSDHGFDVTVRDFSATGCRIESVESLEKGSVAILTFSSRIRTSLTVPVDVRWVRETEDGFAHGCYFLEPPDFGVFQIAEHRRDKQDEDDDTVVWGWVTILAILLGMCLGVFYLIR